MTCTKCGSEDLTIKNCRCGIPCMVWCNVCQKTDHDNPDRPPHTRQPQPKRHDWRTHNRHRYCDECGIQQRKRDSGWVTEWPTFGPSFTKPFCEGEVEPERPTFKVTKV